MTADWESIAAAWVRSIEDHLARRLPPGSWRQLGEVKSSIAASPGGVDVEIFLVHEGLAQLSADHGRYVLLKPVQYSDDLVGVASGMAEIAAAFSNGPVRRRDRFWGGEIVCEVGGEVVSLALMRPGGGFLPTLYPQPFRARPKSHPFKTTHRGTDG